MITAYVEINLDRLNEFRSRVEAELKGSRKGPIHDAFIQWGARYRAYVSRRFKNYSRGGSDGTSPRWKPLKHPRKHGRGKYKKASVLIDTGVLWASLSATFKPGFKQRRVAYGLNVGFGGPHRHPKGKATIADIGTFHHFGKGRLPQRKIIVKPPKKVQRQMRDDLQRGIDRLLDAGN